MDYITIYKPAVDNALIAVCQSGGDIPPWGYALTACAVLAIIWLIHRLS